MQASQHHRSITPPALQRLLPMLALLALLALPAIGIGAPMLLPDHAGMLALLWLFIALALGWSLLAGLAGYISLGDVLFFVIGMQVSAAMRLHVQPMPSGTSMSDGAGLLPMLALAMPAAGITAMLAAIVLGALLLGMRRHLFTFCTLGLALSAGVLSSPHGQAGIPAAPSLPATPLASPDHQLLLHHAAFMLALLAILLHLRLRASRLRLALQAIREDEGKAILMGQFTHRSKVVAWAIAAFLAGMAGALFDSLQALLPPATLRIIPADPVEIGAWVILMAILGGRSTLHGPIIGALIVFTMLVIAITAPPPLPVPVADGLIAGVLILVIALWLPRGLTTGPGTSVTITGSNESCAHKDTARHA